MAPGWAAPRLRALYVTFVIFFQAPLAKITTGDDKPVEPFAPLQVIAKSWPEAPAPSENATEAANDIVEKVSRGFNLTIKASLFVGNLARIPPSSMGEDAKESLPLSEIFENGLILATSRMGWWRNFQQRIPLIAGSWLTFIGTGIMMWKRHTRVIIVGIWVLLGTLLYEAHTKSLQLTPTPQLALLLVCCLWDVMFGSERGGASAQPAAGAKGQAPDASRAARRGKAKAKKTE